MPQHLALAIEEGIAIVTLRRAPANAMTLEVLVELAGLLPRLREPDVRAVVLRGDGRFFSAGLDLFAVLDYDEAENAAFMVAFDEAMRGWFALDRPVIAALNGHAIAGGLVLAATADFRIGVEGAGRVGLTEILVGVPFPATAIEPVRFSFPAGLLPEMLYRGSTWTMAEGKALGVVDRLVSAEELDAVARGLARELGAHTRAGFVGTKLALRGPTLARLDAAPGADPTWALWRDPEVRASLAAYRERTLRKG